MAPPTPAPAHAVSQAAERGLVTTRLSDTIDRDSFTPALLGLLNNVLVWGGSRVLMALHGVGTNEWRIMSALGNHPGSTAQELCVVLGINKSIASKSVNLLIDAGHIGQIDGKRGSRHLFLTPAGAQLHDDLMAIVLARVGLLQHRLSDAEVSELNRLLRKMLDSADDLQEYERQLLSGAAQPPTTRSAPNGVPER